MKPWSKILFLSGLLAGNWVITAADESAYESVFDGATLKGWHVSAQAGHSRVSQHKSGGKWVVIVGSQNVPGNGCFLITDACFEDLEIVMEMNNDFGPDSGLLLRSTKDGKAWQAIIDYHAGRNVMGIYDEGLEGKPHVRNYSFRQTV